MKALGTAAYLIASILAVSPSIAQERLIVSTWGGNWKEGAEIIATEFTKRTGMPVEFITGGTLDRLAKAKVARGRPETDVTYTTQHVGYMYAADGLLEKLDLNLIPNSADLRKGAIRSDYIVAALSSVYTPVFRTDLMPAGYKIDSWKALEDKNLQGKIGLPDFDPGSVVIGMAISQGKSINEWESLKKELLALKPNIKAFYNSDANSLNLIRTGETPVQVMMSANAYNLIDQGVPIKIEIPKEGVVRHFAAFGVNAGTKKSKAAHEFINVALDPVVQEKLSLLHKNTPMNAKTPISDAIAKLPGVFRDTETWQKQSIDVDDKSRATLLPIWQALFAENMMVK